MTVFTRSSRRLFFDHHSSPHEGFHDIGIKLLPCLAGDFRPGSGAGNRGAAGAPGQHGVQTVRNREDSSRQRDPCARKAVRITIPLVSFVMEQGDIQHNSRLTRNFAKGIFGLVSEVIPEQGSTPPF